MRSLVQLATVITTIFILMLAWGCEKQEPVSPAMKGYDNHSSETAGFTKPIKFPVSDSMTLLAVRVIIEIINPDGTIGYIYRYRYGGGEISLSQGSSFKVFTSSLTPPDTVLGDPITITMMVDYDKSRKELKFEFGPHGCEFDPPAEVWLKWSQLNTNNVKLYYIDDNGNYIQQNPDLIDLQGQKMLVRFPHFSRYAIGAE